jgi:hypothetical protein
MERPRHRAWLLAVPLLAGAETLGAGAERPLVRHEASRMSMACEYAIVAYAADAGTLPGIVEAAFDEVDRVDRSGCGPHLLQSAERKWAVLTLREAARFDVRSTLAGGGARAVAGASWGWPRLGLVGAQVAVGVVLLVAAGLLSGRSSISGGSRQDSTGRTSSPRRFLCRTWRYATGMGSTREVRLAGT